VGYNLAVTWFFLALVAPFLYAVTNHIDKALISKYFKEGGVGTLILFSSLLSAIAIPVILFFEPNVLTSDLSSILLLSLVGILDIAILWCYLVALEGDEPSIIIVFYQLVPVFALLFGFILLGESLSYMQLIAMAIVMFGTTLVSVELDENNRFKLRRKTVIYMTLAAAAWAAESVLFKYVALEENVWRSLFWEHLMLAFVGLLIFILVKKYRLHFLKALKENSGAILGLNVTNEVLYMVGNITVAFAVMLAPVALVLLAEPMQAFFVFIIGLFLSFFFPGIHKEKITAFSLVQKVSALTITTIGTYILLSVT